MENAKGGTRAWLRQTPFGLCAELGAVPLGGHRRLLVQLPPPGPLGGTFCTVAPRNPDVRLLPPTRGKLSPDGTILEVLVRPSAYRTVRWSCSVMLPQLSATAFSLTVTAHCLPGITRAKARLEDRLCRLEAAWCARKKQKETADRMRSLGRLRPKTAGDVPEAQRQQELLEELLPQREEGGRPPVAGSEQLLGPLGLPPEEEDLLLKAGARAAWEEARQLWRRERAAAVSHRPRTAPTAEELDTQECLALADRAEEWVRLQEKLFGPPPGETGPVAERRRVVYDAPPGEDTEDEGEGEGESQREDGAGEPAPTEAQTAPTSATVSEVATELGAGDAASSSSSSSEAPEGDVDPEWLWRRRALERFQWAARRVVLRGRLLRRLALLSALLAAYKDRRRILAVGPREEPQEELEEGAEAGAEAEEGAEPTAGASARHVQLTEDH